MYVEACFELCQENMWPDVRSWWKKFNITDYISDIHGSLGAIKLLTIIASRSKPWPLVVNEVALFLPYVINLQMLLFRFLPYVMILHMLLFRFLPYVMILHMLLFRFRPYVMILQMLLFRFLPYVMILQMLLFRSSSQRQRLA